MTRRLLFLIALYFAIGLQISLAAPVLGLGWDIDIILLVLVIIASKTGRGEAVIWAALVGFALDAFDPSSMGGQIVAKSSAIFIFGIIVDAMNLEQPLLLAATVLLLTLIDRIIFRLFSPFITQFGWTFLRYDLPSAILTALVGLLFLWIAMRAGIFAPRASEEQGLMS